MTTTVGTISVARRYYCCSRCKATSTPWDLWAGVGKERLSAGARRLACLAASVWSFDLASAGLKELCGLSISDQTIQRVCWAQGEQARVFLEESPQAVAAVGQGSGEREFLSDGTSVNTTSGWREMRLTVASRRPAGQSMDPLQWEGLSDRKLPKPTARLAMARLADSVQMGDLWAATALRTGMKDGQDVSVIADGAKWIWGQVDRVLPRAERVVDVYHVSQHLHQCGQALYGQGTAASSAWAQARLSELVKQGASVCLWTIERLAEQQKTAATRRPLEELAGYLRPNLAGLRYGDRLKRGLTIGSGQIEGACKTIVGRRLKLNSARWRPEMTERMGALCCLHYSNLWDPFWGTAAA